MKKFVLPLLSISFVVLAVAGEVKDVNITEMGCPAEMGWVTCIARERVPAPTAAEDGKLSLLVLPAEPIVGYADLREDVVFRGVRLLLCNRTGKELSFPICDGYLNFIQQAKDKDGKWKPIEREVVGWCGNSYGSRQLPAGQAWQFAAPKYAGSFKTKLRFHMSHNGKDIYSAEFEGSINPGQFVRKLLPEPEPAEPKPSK